MLTHQPGRRALARSVFRRSTSSPGLIVRNPDRARAAHLLRRTTLPVDRAKIDRLADQSWDDGVSVILAEAESEDPGTPPTSDDDSTVVIAWWLDRMAAPESGLREKMAWFWHTVLTTGAEKVSDDRLVGEQLAHLRTNALTDYRTLLHGFVTSGALLDYLDASGSIASNPNENLGRELLELFSLGRGDGTTGTGTQATGTQATYTQDDVRAASRAVAGWDVVDGEVEWRRENAFVAPLVFRGVQDDWDTTKLVDYLCDQPETAANIGAKVWAELVGTELNAQDRSELGRWWSGRDLAIDDLVERVLSEPTMTEARLARPRSGLEWYIAFRSIVYGPDSAASSEDVSTNGPWTTDQLGQMPYHPPNVGGWPGGRRWLESGSLLARSSLAFGVDPETMKGGRSGTTADLLDRCGLHEVSESTIAALDGVRSSDELPAESAALTRWRLALACPELSLA